MIVIANFSKVGWTVPLENENAEIIKPSLEKLPITSKRKPDLIETDNGKEFVSKIFSDLLNKSNIKKQKVVTPP